MHDPPVADTDATSTKSDRLLRPKDALRNVCRSPKRMEPSHTGIDRLL